jgi:hypothetical protein
MAEDSLLDEFEASAGRRRWSMFAVLSLMVVVVIVAYPLVTNLSSTGSKPTPVVTHIPVSRAAQLRFLEHKTSQLRELKPLRPVTVTFLQSAAFSKRLDTAFNSGLTKRVLAVDRQEYVLGGTVPATINLQRVLTGGVASQIAGWYSYASKKLYIRDTGQALGIDRWYIAHEYTHALQDQHFGLARMERDPVHHHVHNSDHYLAAKSLIEGDAVTLQYSYLSTYTENEKHALFQQLSKITTPSSMPRAIEEQFQFPYSDGPLYVQNLLSNGGYAAVDRAFRHPPTTSYQLMFPGRSVKVLPVNLTTVPASFAQRGWKLDDCDVDGAFGMQQLVEQYVSSSQASDLAQLWSGDRYMLIQKGDTYAMLMESRYADHGDAVDAQLLIEQALGSRFGGLLKDSAGQWGTSGGIYGAIHFSADRIFIAFARNGAVARSLATAARG